MNPRKKRSYKSFSHKSNPKRTTVADSEDDFHADAKANDRNADPESASPDEAAVATDEHSVRLHKYLAEAGIGSRRHCEEYILAGRVTVDGEPVRDLGVSVDPRKQTVRLDGELVKPQPKRYFLLNKPPGFLCTHRDPSGRPRAIDLLPQDGLRLFTVGRLDESSQGLLLVTNDGELANRLAHPRYRVPRIYQVQVVGKPSRETLHSLKKGMYFTEGKFRAQSVRYLRSRGKSSFLELTLTEGRNREIRRMLARAGHKVIQLERIGFGPIRLGRLAQGKFRPLKPSEVKLLRNLLEERGEQRTAGASGRAAPKKRGQPASKRSRSERSPRKGHPASKKKSSGHRKR